MRIDIGVLEPVLRSSLRDVIIGYDHMQWECWILTIFQDVLTTYALFCPSTRLGYLVSSNSTA